MSLDDAESGWRMFEQLRKDQLATRLPGRGQPPAECIIQVGTRQREIDNAAKEAAEQLVQRFAPDFADAAERNNVRRALAQALGFD